MSRPRIGGQTGREEATFAPALHARCAPSHPGPASPASTRALALEVLDEARRGHGGAVAAQTQGPPRAVPPRPHPAVLGQGQAVRVAGRHRSGGLRQEHLGGGGDLGRPRRVPQLTPVVQAAGVDRAVGGADQGVGAASRHGLDVPLPGARQHTGEEDAGQGEAQPQPATVARAKHDDPAQHGDGG